MKDKRIHCVPNIHFEDHPYFGENWPLFILHKKSSILPLSQIN